MPVRTPPFVLAFFALALLVACGGGGNNKALGHLTGQTSPTTFARAETPAPSATPGSTPSATPSATPTATPTASGTPRPTPQACDEITAAARMRPSVVRIETRDGTGTGVVVGADLVITAEHVVNGVTSARLTLADGRTANGTVVARRQQQDLAVLRSSIAGLSPAAWGDDRTLRPGQPLLALGFALDIPGEPSLVGGRFSARRTENGVDLIQTDAPLNPGNSGGPIFTQCAEVVGIVSFGLTDGTGLNFGIAARHARALAENPTGGASPAPSTPTTAPSATARPSAPPTPAPTAAPRSPTPSRPPATATPPLARQVVVAKLYGAALRSAASSDAAIVDTLACGAVLTVLGSSPGGWLRVQTAGAPAREGWVGEARIREGATPAPDCRGAGLYRAGDTVMAQVQSGCLNLRDTPSRTATILKCVENGARFTIRNGPIEVDGEDWFQATSTTLGTGWVLADFLRPAR